MRKNTIIIFCLLLFPICLLAQTGTIKGFVYDEESGEVVPYANVFVKGANTGASTDNNGFFLVDKLPEGKLVVRVTYIGYKDHYDTINLKAGQTLSLRISIQPSAISTQVIKITGEQEARRTETNVSIEKIVPSQIKQMPAIGGQADLAQYLQVLPGVIFTGDQGGQLFIRGGSLIQNKLLLDGMIVYNPFHSIGLFSVLETDIILSADIYTGGFGAEYGGRISSIMDITTRDGNKKRVSGKASMSTFGANLLLEGPLKKETPGNKSTTSFILAAKNSYLSESSKIFYPYIDGGLPYDFFDFYSKLSFASLNGSKISFYGFNFSDNVKQYKSLADYNWNNYGVGANFIILPGNSSLVEGVVAYSDYKIEMNERGSDVPRVSEIGGFSLGFHVSNFYGKNRLKYGVDIQSFATNYSFMSNAGTSNLSNFIEETGNTNEISAFLTYKWVPFDKFLIEPGVRLIYYGSVEEFSPEPRLAAKYNATERLRFKLATGYYTQDLLDTKSEKDVVNLFTGFISVSENLNIPKTFKGKEVNSYLQKSIHFIAGAEYDLFKHISLNLEGYYKYFPQLISLNRNKQFDNLPEYREDGAYPKPEYLRYDFIIEEGSAYGLDLSAKYDYDRLYIWFVYSLGEVIRTDEVQTYHPYYDRRQNLNFLCSYTFGKSRDWEINFRWNYGSGFPFTETQGGYEKLDFSQGINSDYINTNGQLGIQYADFNEGRLPQYHRLDFMVKKRFSLGKRAVLEANISISNLYNRNNMFYFNRVTFERVDQLPIMPSFGVQITF